MKRAVIILSIAMLLIVLLTPVQGEETLIEQNVAGHIETQYLGSIIPDDVNVKYGQDGTFGDYFGEVNVFHHGQGVSVLQRIPHTVGDKANIGYLNISLRMEGAGAVTFFIKDSNSTSVPNLYTKEELLPKTWGEFKRFNITIGYDMTDKGDVFVGVSVPFESYEYLVKPEILDNGSGYGYYYDNGGLQTLYPDRDLNMTLVYYENGYDPVTTVEYHPSPMNTGYDYLEAYNVTGNCDIPSGTSFEVLLYNSGVLNKTVVVNQSGMYEVPVHLLNLSCVTVKVYSSFESTPTIETIYINFYHNNCPKIVLTKREVTVQRNAPFDLWDYVSGWDDDSDELVWNVSNESPNTSVPITYIINITLSDGGINGTVSEQFTLHIFNSRPVIDDFTLSFVIEKDDNISYWNTTPTDGDFVEFVSPVYNSSVRLNAIVNGEDADGDNLTLIENITFRGVMPFRNSTIGTVNLTLTDGYLEEYIEVEVAVVIPLLYIDTVYDTIYVTEEVPIYVNNTITEYKEIEVPVFINNTEEIEKVVFINNTEYVYLYNDTKYVNSTSEVSQPFNKALASWVRTPTGSSIIAVTIISLLLPVLVYVIYLSTRSGEPFGIWVKQVVKNKVMTDDDDDLEVIEPDDVEEPDTPVEEDDEDE